MFSQENRHAVFSASCIIMKLKNKRGGCSQVVKTAGCGSAMHGFESHHPPQNHINISMGYSQVVRQWILIPSCAGSNPATLANGDIAKW